EEAGHLAAGDDPRILRHGDLDGAGVRRGRDAGIRAPALARVHRGDAPVAHMVAVDVADENGVDLAEALVVRTRDRAADVVENARAVRVLEDQSAVAGTELSVVAAERRDLDVARLRGGASGEQRARAQC